jgi:hypothetical protein
MPASPAKLFLAACTLFTVACLAVVLWAPWTGPDLAALDRESRRDEDLERKSQALARILEGKQQLVAELVAGGLTLPEAAERFRRLNAAFAEGNLSARQVGAGEEDLCRRVLAWAGSVLEGKPERAAVLTRLKAEYRARFDHDPGPWPVPPPEAELPAIRP